MADPEHLEILKRGVKEWNQWREAHPEIKPFFVEANLTEANLTEANLSGAFLTEANLAKGTLTRADLTGADLSGAFLSGADLSGAFLDFANLTAANLTGANLIGANLVGANLTGANLTGANLMGAILGQADFTEADLSRAFLSRAFLMRANLTRATLIGATLTETILAQADLSKANLRGANLQYASLLASRLMNANFDEANLTKACLWETQRAGWSIKGVICESIYWDQHGGEEIFYSPGEFEKLFADKTKVKLFYKDSINPLEIATIPALIKHLEDLHPGCGLRLVSIHEDSGGVVVELTIEDAGDQSPEQLKQLKTEIEITAQRAIEYERKFLAEEKVRGQLEARLDELRLWFGEQQRLLASANQVNIIGGNVGDTKTYNVSGQAGAVGDNAIASNMTFNQIVNHFEQSIDLQALAKELAELRQAMSEKQGSSPQTAIALGKVAEAEIAAQEKNPSKVVESLKAAGEWTLDFAKEIGKDVVVAAIKQSMGML